MQVDHHSWLNAPGRPTPKSFKSRAFFVLLSTVLILSMLLPACAPVNTPSNTTGPLKVVAVETFLADIAQNVAGDRVTIEALMPLGVDPHAFEPTPRDIAKISECSLLIINGAGFEQWMSKTLENGSFITLEASSGLTSRTAREGEVVEGAEQHDHEAMDPHFWLDPISVIHYVENIRDSLIQVDPEGKDVYTQNAEQYILQLKELDQWIATQVAQVPAEKRKMVTNHESFGYFADRYGFQIIGTVIPSVSSSAAPSAQQLAHLVDTIRATNAPAIFLETGSNPQLADQVAEETGVKVITGLYTHSITAPDGEAPTYLQMMRVNTNKIITGLQ